MLPENFDAEKPLVVEYFKDVLEAEQLINELTHKSFIDELCTKYHYPDEEKSVLLTVAMQIQKCILKDAAFSYRIPHSVLHGISDSTGISDSIDISVVITLGEGIDILQEEYTEKGMLSECYMAEVIAAEILLKSYTVCNQRIKDILGVYVSRLIFPGSVPEHGVEEAAKLVKECGLDVTCNSSYSLIPKKSVAFYCLLSDDKNTVCEGICSGCGRTDCPNRIDIREYDVNTEKLTDFTQTAFNYGYARIFGRQYN
jgi:hypothetical protein